MPPGYNEHARKSMPEVADSLACLVEEPGRERCSKLPTSSVSYCVPGLRLVSEKGQAMTQACRAKRRPRTGIRMAVVDNGGKESKAGSWNQLIDRPLFNGSASKIDERPCLGSGV